ncbi:MAG: YajG family lipoprotein [Pasteurellaceae bacterium]|nr:YajG family lipoprotein [Pasteurellaceae bacterium]
MKQSKSLLLLGLLASTLVVGCQTASNTITFATPSPSAVFNTHNQTAMVNVMTQDLRPSKTVASYTQMGKLQPLTVVPEVAQLFQQVMQQNLNSKGFPVVQGAANANVVVNIKQFSADVEQGNLRYKVTANVNVEVVVQGARGTVSKNFTTSRAYEGAFGANHDEIQKVLGEAYSAAVLAIYHDNEISQAIHHVK